jgi:hypothetical protein
MRAKSSRETLSTIPSPNSAPPGLCARIPLSFSRRRCFRSIQISSRGELTKRFRPCASLALLPLLALTQYFPGTQPPDFNRQRTPSKSNRETRRTKPQGFNPPVGRDSIEPRLKRAYDHHINPGSNRPAADRIWNVPNLPAAASQLLGRVFKFILTNPRSLPTGRMPENSARVSRSEFRLAASV